MWKQLEYLYYKFHWYSFEINEKHFHEPGLEQDTKLKEKYFYMNTDIFFEILTKQRKKNQGQIDYNW